MYKYCLIFFLIIFSCKEKNSFKELSINENILKEIKTDRKESKKPGVYIVSLFTDHGNNICEIVKYQEVLVATNFKGCQILDKDTIFLYTDKEKSFSKCYKFMNNKISFNKREPIPGNKKEIGYYRLDTLNCSIKRLN